ncbi:hypothetical protein [Luteibacter sp. dw_328]|uniref:hypothetical protein n=1 Tax=Luteibacter sp. dw_328 TaxID=2719796 RepID=UPI001BD39891|nr:hypothetical protein [Luteibacter sp. dw_328]
MNKSITGRECSAFKKGIDTEATTHELLNDATEWLQYARGLTELLAELVHESDTVDCRRMALGLEAISAITRMGLQCTAHAHAHISWETSQDTQDRSDA